MRIQRYVSDELTHFIGRGSQPDDQYALLLRILSTGLLAQPSYAAGVSPQLTVNYAGSICNDDMFSPQIVCFCDIPEADFEIHMRKYSRFGIAFKKSFLVPKGATPVHYVAKNSTLPPADDRCSYFDRMIGEFFSLFDSFQSSLARSPASSEADEIRRRIIDLRRFLEFGIFSFVKFFDDTYPDDHPENFYMEREWRLLGAVKFDLLDVERIIMPREYAAQFRTDVPQYVGQLSFVDQVEADAP